MAKRLNKKVCMLGDFAVGKTSLIRRFVYSLFDDKYISTIGVKVSRKSVNIPTDQGVVELAMMLWDLAGSDKFTDVQASYYRGAAGAVLVCDLTRPETLHTLNQYAENIRRISPKIQFVLAANKYDLTAEHQISSAELQTIGDNLSASYYLTSAKIGENVEDMFRHLGKLLAI